jgi:hypothetical protein
VRLAGNTLDADDDLYEAGVGMMNLYSASHDALDVHRMLRSRVYNDDKRDMMLGGCDPG